MDAVFRVVAALVGAFLLGSVPFAVLVSRIFFKRDIREFGSGNPGATNVLRTFGPVAGGATFVLDILKGAAAVYLATLLAPAVWSADGRDWLMIAAAMAAIAGHSFSPFIGFKGGKGVATAAGAIGMLMPVAFWVLFLMFVVILLITRMVSLGSITIAIEFPVLCVLLYGDRTPMLLFGLLGGGLVVWRHHANLKRIFRGEEHRIGSAT
ncbi:MAG: acyl-phosphate glycerol 3-phosphate acyltransferase [Actinobacteria bacterium HGW-Actinobacteria-6]|nr:MAG: acyl-phosphate glycerol 3-phosphate acyltransferase [Actinobacteria bacterium HGW-Actinobacteria-6]